MYQMDILMHMRTTLNSDFGPGIAVSPKSPDAWRGRVINKLAH
jgi:hypothetical protein